MVWERCKLPNEVRGTAVVIIILNKKSSASGVPEERYFHDIARHGSELVC